MTGIEPIRLRVDLAYDGGPFAGFARQPDRTTVQGVLEDALSRLLDQPVLTTCAGRTDRGVHALGQVVHLDVDPTPPRAMSATADPDGLGRRLDRMTGDPVTVWRVARVPASFDARFSATERRYRYRLVDGGPADPRLRGLRWRLDDRLNASWMRAAGRRLVGEHDFASFCRRAEGGTTVRTLRSLTVRRVGVEIEVALRGPAFCHQQVRSIVGCLVEVGRGRRPPGWLDEVVAARDRSRAARVAPPHGLTLESVSYGPGIPASPPPDAR